MTERSLLIEWIRGEIVGPSQPITEAVLIDFSGGEFVDPIALRNGTLTWRPNPETAPQEVLYFERETPHRKYGAGALHPSTPAATPPPDQQAANASDTLGIEPEVDEVDDSPEGDGALEQEAGDQSDLADPSGEFEVTSPDIRHPSTIGISFCVHLETGGRLVVRLPHTKRFRWQEPDRDATEQALREVFKDFAPEKLDRMIQDVLGAETRA